MAPRFLTSISPGRWQLILNVLGVVILLAGYSAAAHVWLAQDRLDRENDGNQTANDATPLGPLDSRKDTRQIELYYGKTGLLMESWTEWAESLTHGKRLAKTIIILSSAAAIGCFLAGGGRRVKGN